MPGQAEARGLEASWALIPQMTALSIVRVDAVLRASVTPQVVKDFVRAC